MQLSESARTLPDKELKSTLLLSYGGLSALSFTMANFFGLLYFRSPLTLDHAVTYLFFGIHSLLLYSASSRERLEATTFRILIPTLIISGAFYAVKVYAMKSMLSQAGRDSEYRNSPWRTGLYRISQCYARLRNAEYIELGVQEFLQRQ